MPRSEISQVDRIASLSTPLGANVLVLDSVVIREELSKPFSIEADLLSESADVNFEDIIGQSVTITLLTKLDDPRFFNGIVRRFSQRAMRSRYAAYHMEVVPKLWSLNCNAQCRIFQNKSVPEIIEKVLEGLDIELALTGSYDPRVYCVQYRESDMNFVQRLMEEEGIYYFFKHEEGKHSMVIADSAGAHEVLLPEYSTVAYRPYDGSPTGDEFIYDWAVDKTLLPASYTHTDYDFETPRKSLMTRSMKARSHALAVGEVYDYPGSHSSFSLGEQRARVRLEELQADYEVGQGKTDSRGLQCGFKFDLKDHPRGDQNCAHLVTSAVHVIQLDALESGNLGDTPPYLCEFTTQPFAEPFRAECSTPCPIVQGPQTAVVVGPGGEEIYTDEHGRVKVQFHWDREGKRNEDSSCWVRVSSAWAGQGWGEISVPRIGQEVIVDFLEGDPDHPIITGRVYNGTCPPPFALPGQKMVSGIKSNSTPGGGGYNEFSLNDTKGTEKIVIHGQYDMETTILHDDEKTVGNNETTDIKNERFVTVGTNHTETVKFEQKKTVGTSRYVTVVKNETIKIGSSQSTTIGAKRDLTVGGTDSNTIVGTRSTTVGASESLTVGGSIAVTGGVAVSISAGGAITITGGGVISITAGGAMTISAGAALAITAPVIALNGRPILPLPPGTPI